MSAEFDEWQEMSERRMRFVVERAEEKRENFRAAIAIIAMGIVGLLIGLSGEIHDPSTFIWGGVGLITLTLVIQRWFWISAFLIASLTLAITCLACIVHFMIFQAVLAAIGAFVALAIVVALVDGGGG